MSNDEKVRIEYSNIFMYRSANKGKSTVIELGYGSDREIINLDINFESFDDKYLNNRKAWKEYWNSQSNKSLY